nr:histone deacetylase hos3 [Quercus suber]
MSRTDRDREVSTLKQLHIPSRTSSPMSSAPTTPRVQTARRTSQATISSPLQHAASPRQQQQPPALRRSSSAISLGGQRPGSRMGTPKMLEKKPSRSSLGGEGTNEKRPTPKRSISNLINSLREAQSSMEPIEEPVPLTAPQIAMAHFVRELQAQGALNATAAETVVILHDACYGHRFSRLKTSKGALSMIVERPERIHAAVLGASTAYVRLGGHHSGARNAPHPDNRQAHPPPFHIRKSARTMEITSSYVTSVHGTEWMAELREMCGVASERLSAGSKELQRSVVSGKQPLHEGDLYLAAESLDAFQGALGGVADAIDAIFPPFSSTSRAFVAVRPPGHHCSTDHPSGFCWLNNVHVGIEYAAQVYGLTHAAIIDFDLHHGDGSQSITWERNSQNNQKRLNAKPNSKLKLGPDIGYYSVHDINSYPCEYGDDEKVQAASLCIDNAHSQSVWNVHLQTWKTEEEFWTLYETQYRVLLDKAKAFLYRHTENIQIEGKVQPKAAIFISAGFDASEWEGSGMQRHKVNVPTEFYARFTRDIVHLSQDQNTGCAGRVISVLEGGYSDRALCSGVMSHISGLCTSEVTSSPAQKDPAREVALDQMMRGLNITSTVDPVSSSYDINWWSAANLTALDNKVNPSPPTQGKKVRTGPQPTYATPTESFAYKVVDTNKFAQSISGTMRESSTPLRPPTPPPPEVEWVVATQELSKLLIPSDRQTKSYTADELAPIRTKKERASMMPILPSEETAKPRQLRARNAKAPTYRDSTRGDDLESVRSVSQASNRRQTLHDFPITPAQTFNDKAIRQRRLSRRLSAGSTLDGLSTFTDSDPPQTSGMPVNALQVAETSMPPPPIPVPNGMPAKKARAPSRIRKPAVTSSNPSSPIASQPSAFTKPKASHKSMSTNEISSSANVDNVTSGIKKITLKVGSREDHDRKQKEKLEKEAADRRARALKGAETRRVNAAAKKAATTKASVPVRGSAAVGQAIIAPVSARHLPTAVNQGSPNGPAAAGGSSADPFVVPNIIPAVPQTSIVSTNPGNSSSWKLQHAAPANGPGQINREIVPASTTESLPTLQHASSSVPPSPMGKSVSASQDSRVESFAEFPHGAGRQLLREYAIANGAEPLQNAAPPSLTISSPIPTTAMSGGPRSSIISGTSLPVWSSTDLIPFASTGTTPQATAPTLVGQMQTSSPSASSKNMPYSADMPSADTLLAHQPQMSEQELQDLEKENWDASEAPVFQQTHSDWGQSMDWQS